MQAIVPRPDIAPLLQEHFVALAADADLPEPEVHKLMYKVKNATMLPFVILADADGHFLAGSSGAVAPEQLASLLQGVLD